MIRKNHDKQPRRRALPFRVGIFKGIRNTLTYFYKSLSNSMRRRVAFDYLLMYVIVSVLTLIVFTMAFNIIEVGKKNRETAEAVYNLAVLHEKGSYNDDQLTAQLQRIGDTEGTGIVLSIRDEESYMTSNYNNDVYNEAVYEARYMENLWLFLGKGLVKKDIEEVYTYEDGRHIFIQMKLVEDFNFDSAERTVLIIALMISQIIGITVMYIVGSFRLRQVFAPIYGMTKAAEKITLNNMDAKLDISRTEYELKDLASTFNDMIDRIREDYVKQKRFVSDVSHELRTPISVVNGYARMLERWGKKDEAILDESIEAIRDEGKNMQILVENLLTLVRSDNQTLKFEKEYFRIDDLADTLIRDMAMIDEGKHHFTKQIQKDVEVCLDYAKTKQVMRIFIDNAIKYTPEGGDVHLSVLSQGENVVISIKDSGIGVSKEDMPHLFERFYRSDESRTRETGGHGLGLAIAKAIVIGQKGKIQVRSRLGHGTTFKLTLPKSCEEV